MSTLVIGRGEVGAALVEVLGPVREVQSCDVKDDVDRLFDVLNIAFPYGELFEAAVRDYAEAYRPRITIIHSTVPSGGRRRASRDA